MAFNRACCVNLGCVRHLVIATMTSLSHAFVAVSQQPQRRHATDVPSPQAAPGESRPAAPNMGLGLCPATPLHS
ncbi:hypothetical protein JOY44_28510 (plasmid) [Phormidium sp. CLA17]|nr:hypothetical protein [Leptolyngbya sp. Cla-17]